MIDGPKSPRSALARYQPQRQDVESEKRTGWCNHGILVVSENDDRLGWPEQEMIKQLGDRLYGQRRRESHHG